MTLTIGIVAVAAMIIAAAWIFRHKTFKAPPTVLLYGLVIVGGMVYFSNEREASAERDRAACVTRVERSAGNRAYNLTFIAVLQRELSTRPDIAEELIEALDEYLPALTAADC